MDSGPPAAEQVASGLLFLELHMLWLGSCQSKAAEVTDNSGWEFPQQVKIHHKQDKRYHHSSPLQEAWRQGNWCQGKKHPHRIPSPCNIAAVALRTDWHWLTTQMQGPTMCAYGAVLVNHGGLVIRCRQNPSVAEPGVWHLLVPAWSAKLQGSFHTALEANLTQWLHNDHSAKKAFFRGKLPCALQPRLHSD